MSNDDGSARDLRLAIHGPDDAARGVALAHALAAQVGFDAAGQSRFATAVSELTQNVVRYATRGTLRMGRTRRGRLSGVKAVVEDVGPGIANIQEAMREQASTGGGLGLGLPGTRRMVDEFDVKSKLGGGTRVVIVLWRER